MSGEHRPPDLETGTAGASARREHRRRRANREQRVRGRHPRIGGALMALRDDPTHETAWARGARGEELVAAVLEARLCSAAIVLHDRRIPRSAANIDHIAVAPSGIWVIDTKLSSGKVAVQAPLFGRPRLTIAGRDRTKLVDGLVRQVTLVTDAVAGILPGAPVHGALCIVGADLPLLGSLTFRGFPLLHPKPLARRINRGDALPVDRVRPTAVALAELFPVA